MKPRHAVMGMIVALVLAALIVARDFGLLRLKH
jgi:hypothetical protein